ncbi:arsenate reductase (glutaredoxin) [Thioclava sp. F36-7]|uniref:arsenate reductase (glutaredoxin) n=1 Tax=Thioclava sp. F36-7 TaxID=1915317 RepID=UPI000998B48A|nr:arsenate reductase (glutaredoxin) [Thioclava sp. F36-7]OOY09943.1 arsenate reductase (glutaredoxin) [Thioclava sp. F36-7]
MAVTIWHNPRCSKSRETLKLLEARGITPQVRDYQKAPPTMAELQDALMKLGQPAAAMIRWKDTDLPKDADENEILSALSANPKLIERPLVLTDTAARIGRPPETVLEIL